MQPNPDADANAFMRKYLARPTDVTARLVFADWLEETCIPHNAAWAYYIRLRAEADRYGPVSRERYELVRQAEEYAPKIRANLTISAQLFVGYPKSLLQLLPAPNITVKLAGFAVPLSIYELVPESVARENLVFPLDAQGRTLLAATVDPHNIDTAQKLGFILNRDIVLVAASSECVQEAIDRHSGQNPTEVVVGCTLYEFPEAYSTYPLASPAADLDNADAPTARVVALIVQYAIALGADRILITPEPDGVGVRYRIDGEWIERDRMPLRLLRPVTRRIATVVGIPVEWAFANPPSMNPMAGEFPIQTNGVEFRVRATIQPSPDGPTTQIDLIREHSIIF